jgi:thiamine biosynthesis lipoprotein
VEVEDPFDATRALVCFRVRDRAVATSAPNRRHWSRGDERMHHLIDPRVSRPAASDLAQVTVVATSAEQADVLAKTAFIVGAEAARRMVMRLPDAEAILVRVDGSYACIGALEVFDA